jgi:hypothetical protein
MIAFLTTIIRKMQGIDRRFYHPMQSTLVANWLE